MTNAMANMIRTSPMLRRHIATAHEHVDPIVDRFQDKFLIKLAVRTVKELIEDDATHMAAAISYYTMLSMFPLIVGLISVLSFFWHDEAVQGLIITWASGFLPESEEFIRDSVEQIVKTRGAIGVFALIGLFWTGSAIFGGITRSINRAWDVHADRPIYLSKARQLVMAFMTGLLFLASMTINAFVGFTQELELPLPGVLVSNISVAMLYAGSFALIFIVFLMLYKYVPNAKTYWNEVWVGALVAAALFEITEYVFILYLSRFAGFANVYGVFLAPVIVILLWSYVVGLILILGAEISSEYGRLKRGLERGRVALG